MVYPPYISYDERAAYERRYRSGNHSRHSSSSSSISTSSDTSVSYNHNSVAPPRYSYTDYASVDQKPLPLLPASRCNRSESGGERRVTFVVQKPLPPLPLKMRQDGGVRDYASQGRSRSSSSASEKSAMGECAWWTREFFGKPS
ncbi:uncharacterized protein RSE6_12791 [Rhynchosporium secalis]|uniref:DUF4005 domain-containing protein n=1 Tax=Rhynchosporium secalis TaxID=38038 RepID=A0A1E1MRB3_RHYSE|nr:uncharacterized protein RSE6_12791 [Rhynchosporium secalis]